jgi:hypothetical protein
MRYQQPLGAVGVVVGQQVDGPVQLRGQSRRARVIPLEAQVGVDQRIHIQPMA